MRSGFIILCVFFATKLSAATPQDPDILIYENDTIYLDTYPLEEFIKIKTNIRQRLLDSDCVSTGCWRNYIATWKIINDKLCLLELQDPCDLNIIPLGKIFDRSEIKDSVVIASWYKGSIHAGFGKLIGFSEKEFKQIYEKTISFQVGDGSVSLLEVHSR